MRTEAEDLSIMLIDFLEQKGYWPRLHKNEGETWVEVSRAGRRVTIDVRPMPKIVVRVFKQYGATARHVTTLDLRKPASLDALEIAVRHGLYGWWSL